VVAVSLKKKFWTEKFTMVFKGHVSYVQDNDDYDNDDDNDDNDNDSNDDSYNNDDDDSDDDDNQILSAYNPLEHTVYTEINLSLVVYPYYPTCKILSA
jgi:hypothetical protein